MKPIFIDMENITKYKQLYYLEPKQIFKIITGIIFAILLITVVYLHYVSVENFITNECNVTEFHDNYVMLTVKMNEEDISKIKKGMECKCELKSYSNAEYGEICGKIISIEYNITNDYEQTWCEGNILVEIFSSNKRINLVEGMNGKMKILYEKKSALSYYINRIV